MPNSHLSTYSGSCLHLIDSDHYLLHEPLEGPNDIVTASTLFLKVVFRSQLGQTSYLDTRVKY